MRSLESIKKEYEFISKNHDAYLKYLLIFAFKGTRPFEIKTNEVIKYWNNLSPNELDLEKNFEELMNLDGVGFATASAILHFRFPDKYSIIDKNALQGTKLGKLGSNFNKNIEIYEKYNSFLLNKVKNGEFDNLREAELYYFDIGRRKGKG